MSVAVQSRPPIEVGVRTPRFEIHRTTLIWPLLVAIANAGAFYVVRPNVSDLQAAYARESAANHGVGLSYWFQWFGGGSTPGNYSVITPYLSTALGAALVGALSVIAVTPLTSWAVRGLPHPVAGTWMATVTAGLNLWSGRIPFSLGCALALLAIIGLRERRPALLIAGTVASSLASPVSGAFLGLVLAGVFLVDLDRRKIALITIGACGATLLSIAIFFGNPGPQGYPVQSAFFAMFVAAFLLLTRPSAQVRAILYLAILAAPFLFLIPNGMGSNYSRLAWFCLPAAALATATTRRALVALAMLPALITCGRATVSDVWHSAAPEASASYYTDLIKQLDSAGDLTNHRLEVVQDPTVHTAAYALIAHAALAGGWETQEQHRLNGILEDPARLNATSYKVWLDNNAVGYVAVNRIDRDDHAEYQLVTTKRLPYLTLVDESRTWALYRVRNATPIVAPPEKLIKATQAKMTIQVPCACSFPIRVRYSKFLAARTVRDLTADIRDDGYGWTVVTTTSPGTYVLAGDVTRPLH